MNYLKTAINSLLKSRFYSLVNIIGLATGITVCLLIFIYIINELSYESFQKKRKDIYRVTLEWGSEGSKMKFAGSMPALAPAINSQLPEADAAIRLRKEYDAVLKTSGGEEFDEENLFFADPGIFRIFTLNLTQGDPDQALAEPLSMVLTEKASLKYFGTSNPVGKELFFRDYPVRVSGILKIFLKTRTWFVKPLFPTVH